MKKFILPIIWFLLGVVLLTGCGKQTLTIQNIENLKQELPVNQDVVLDNIDGSQVTVCFTSEVLNEDYAEYRHILECGDSKVEFYEYAYMIDSGLYRMNGIWYVFVTYDMASDDNVTEIFQIEGQSMKKIQELEATILSDDIEANEFVMNFTKNMLGTYSTTKTYSFREDGGFETEDEWYVVSTPISERTPIVSIIDITMTIDGQDSTVEKGTGMYVTRIAEEKVEVQLEESGELAVLNVEFDADGFVRIDGEVDWYCFEMLPYAG